MPVLLTALLLFFCIAGTPKAFGQITRGDIRTGFAGEGLKWTYHPDSKTLVIGLDGLVKHVSNYQMLYRQFAKDYLNNFGCEVEYIIVERGVRVIGYRAFESMFNLQHVLFTHFDLELIEDHVFVNTNVKKIIIPQSVHTLERSFLGFATLDTVVAVRDIGYDSDRRWGIILEETIFDKDFFNSTSRPKTLYIRPDAWANYANGESEFTTWLDASAAGKHQVKNIVFVDSVKIDSAIELTTFAKKTVRPAVTFSPSDATDKYVRWSSSDPSVVYVSPVTGVITARRPGTATITAYANNHGYCAPDAKCQITVRDASDASLKTLKINDYVIAAVPDVLEYKVTMPNTETKITITGDPIEHMTTVSKETKLFTTNELPFVIQSTAEDGTNKFYTVILKRLSTVATLKNLYINGQEIYLSPVKYDYTVSVPNSTDKITVASTPTDIFAATVKHMEQIPLNSATNTFTITVTAEDTAFRKNYSITVKKQNANAALKKLTLNGQEIDGFASNTLNYTLVVPNETTYAVAMGEPEDPLAVASKEMKPLTEGDNVLTVTCVAEDTSVKQNYTVTIKRKSSNVKLKSLSINDKALTLYPNTSTHGGNVPFNTTSVAIDVITEHPEAKVKTSGPSTLSVGDNIFTITVTAEDSTLSQSYSLIVKRLYNDATLSGIKINGNVAYGFNPADTIYSETVSGGGAITLTPEINHPKARATLYSPSVLTDGENIFTVKVEAEDTTVTRNYTIKIYRLSSNVALKSLSINDKALTLYPDITTYRDSVPNNSGKALIEAKASHPNTIAETEGSIDLNIGENSTFVTVIPEDKTSMKIYRLTIMRLNNDIALSSLSINGIPIPEFNQTYNASVSYNVTEIAIEIKARHPAATVAMNGPRTLSLGDNLFIVTVIAEDTTFRQDYTLTVKRLNFEATLAGDTSTYNTQTYVPEVLQGASGISKTAAATVQVYCNRQGLHVASPVAERVYVYSITGTLLGSFDKRAGKASFGLTGSPTGLMIVKGGSGWSRKIVVSD
jgi:uncharacterized protein YjdB